MSDINQAFDKLKTVYDDTYSVKYIIKRNPIPQYGVQIANICIPNKYIQPPWHYAAKAGIYDFSCIKKK